MSGTSASPTSMGLLAVLGLTGLVSFGLLTDAPDGAHGIRVVGRGEAVASASHIEVRARVSATAEIASEALAEYRETRLRAVKALEKAGVANLTVRGLGMQVSYLDAMDDESMMFNPMARNTSDEPQIHYEEVLLLTVSGVEELDAAAMGQAITTLVDTALDSGLELASTGIAQMIWWAGASPEVPEPETLLTLRLADRADLELRAYEGALVEARRRAQAIADLSNLTLGKVHSIEVLETTESWITASTENVCTAVLSVEFAIE